jgi:deferrochelatase/peroxidase EfeB
MGLHLFLYLSGFLRIFLFYSFHCFVITLFFRENFKIKRSLTRDTFFVQQVSGLMNFILDIKRTVEELLRNYLFSSFY